MLTWWCATSRAGHTFSFSVSVSSGIGGYPKPPSTHSGRWFRIPVRALDSSSRTRAFNWADEAALKANVKLVTWRQFQADLYERWLDAVWTRLTLMADALYELVDAEPGSHPTLMSEAIKAGRVVASVEVNRAAARRWRLCHRVAQISRSLGEPPSDRIQVRAAE